MHNHVSFKSFFLSLSSLLDSGNNQLIGHQLKTAFIAWKIGNELELDSRQMNSLLIASLVHDIGAISLEEKLDIKKSTVQVSDSHSIKGWYILQQIPNFQEIAEAVKYHHTSYQILQETQLLAQIINISDYIERLINNDSPILEQKKEIIIKIQQNDNFNPKLVRIIEKVEKVEKYWLDLVNPKLLFFFDKVPIDSRILSNEILVSLSFLIRDIIDFKSPFTINHSLGVTYCSNYMAEKEGLEDRDLADFSIAGLLHDIGKVTVPNSIIMKKSALTVKEMSLMSQHSYYSYRFLKEAGYSKRISLTASCHHERLDGSGYPFRFDKEKLGFFQKIMAVCDVFIALLEDRPYRKRMSKNSIEEIMYKLTPDKLDRILVKKLMLNYDSLKLGVDELSLVNRERYNIINKF